MEISDELRQFVTENFLFSQTDGALGNDDSFLEKGIIDSTGVLELIGFLQDHYGIEIADQDLVPENLDSINRLTRFVVRHLPAVEELAECKSTLS
jgi:acyl carrier protein